MFNCSHTQTPGVIVSRPVQSNSILIGGRCSNGRCFNLLLLVLADSDVQARLASSCLPGAFRGFAKQGLQQKANLSHAKSPKPVVLTASAFQTRPPVSILIERFAACVMWKLPSGKQNFMNTSYSNDRLRTNLQGT
jgi:hypothetical protein